MPTSKIEFKSRRHLWMLDKAQTVGHLELPAGSVAYFQLNAPKDRNAVKEESTDEIQWLEHTAEFGLMLENGMKPAEEGAYLLVQLPEKQQIQGLPCASGKASFCNEGTLSGCRLYAAFGMTGRLDSESNATQHTLPRHA